MIALSYTFYAPVILWAAAVPMLGMLMVPKTCAYLGVALYGAEAETAIQEQAAAYFLAASAAPGSR